MDDARCLHTWNKKVARYREGLRIQRMRPLQRYDKSGLLPIFQWSGKGKSIQMQRFKGPKSAKREVIGIFLRWGHNMNWSRVDKISKWKILVNFQDSPNIPHVWIVRDKISPASLKRSNNLSPPPREISPLETFVSYLIVRFGIFETGSPPDVRASSMAQLNEGVYFGKNRWTVLPLHPLHPQYFSFSCWCIAGTPPL